MIAVDCCLLLVKKIMYIAKIMFIAGDNRRAIYAPLVVNAIDHIDRVFVQSIMFC